MTGEEASGRTFTVNAAQVVLADGGFQSDAQALLGNISPAPEKVFQRNARSGLGDGLRMAREAGAALSDLRGFYGHLLSADAFTNDRLWPHLWLDYVAAAGLLCGRDGRRFCDEGLGGVSMANRVAALADPLGASVVMDSATWREVGAANIQAPNPRLREQGGTVHEAASLRALARLANIDEAGLVRQVEQHNAALAARALETLQPPRTTGAGEVRPIVKPPFLAIPVCAGITYTMGGVRIDGQSRVLDQAGVPIEGLYAAGSTTGGLEGGPQVGYVGGLIKASVTGLCAAETILGIKAENR